jgi:hypothetical protein
VLKRNPRRTYDGLRQFDLRDKKPLGEPDKKPRGRSPLCDSRQARSSAAHLIIFS